MIIYDFKTNEYSSYLKDSLIENDVRTMRKEEVKFLPMVIYLLKKLIMQERSTLMQMVL